MSIEPGTHRLGPGSGRLLVRTSRTGLGRRAGHDLTIEVTRWHGTAEVRPELARSVVTVSAEVASFEVREGTGGVKPLTDDDRREIRRIIAEEILHAYRHPTIDFTSTGIGPGSAEGDLTIMGRTRPVTVRWRETKGGRVTGSAVVAQTRWGIKPYSALFGALKLADEVKVEFDLRSGPS